MLDTEWVVLDVETTGFSTPIYVVELAAQRMRGWSADGGPFRRLVNHGAEIPGEASRVHGYTKEILERDGCHPFEVYRDFAEYVGPGLWCRTILRMTSMRYSIPSGDGSVLVQ